MFRDKRRQKFSEKLCSGKIRLGNAKPQCALPLRVKQQKYISGHCRPQGSTCIPLFGLVINHVLVVDISIKLFFGLTTCKLLCVKQYCVAQTGESVISEQSLPRWHSLILQSLCLIMQMLLRVLKEKAGISNCVDLLVYILDTSSC